MSGAGQAATDLPQPRPGETALPFVRNAVRRGRAKVVSWPGAARLAAPRADACARVRAQLLPGNTSAGVRAGTGKRKRLVSRLSQGAAIAAATGVNWSLPGAEPTLGLVPADGAAPDEVPGPVLEARRCVSLVALTFKLPFDAARHPSLFAAGLAANDDNVNTHQLRLLYANFENFVVLSFPDSHPDKQVRAPAHRALRRCARCAR